MEIPLELIGIIERGEIIVATSANQASLACLGLSFIEQDGELLVTPKLDMLDGNYLKEQLPKMPRLEVFSTLDSTNARLMTMSPFLEKSVCIAEHQSLGRGRRGREWLSPFGRNIYMSMTWKVPVGTGVSGLSLVVGMQVLQTMRAAGVGDVGLKWPNDLLLEGGKLAGILIEIAAVGERYYNVVIGIGINLLMSSIVAAGLDRPWSDAGKYLNMTRSSLVVDLVTNLAAELDRFCELGFKPYKSSWDAFNLFADKEVVVYIGEDRVSGFDRGVDSVGNLLLETTQGVRSYSAGEVSLRAGLEA